MSAINKPTLDIFPPVLTPFTKKEEVFYTVPLPCPYCNGVGNVLGKQTGPGDYDRETCPICFGKRENQAKITIDWMPKIKRFVI
jgi:hypothetical protein